MARRLRNVRGTKRGRRRCRCGPWIDHYYTHGGTGAQCVVCRATPVDGAHVVIEESLFGGLFGWDRLKGEFIAPLCGACNHPEVGDWLDVVIGFELISANTQRMGCASR